jgi:predicted RNase H-like HicB family nuclease
MYARLGVTASSSIRQSQERGKAFGFCAQRDVEQHQEAGGSEMKRELEYLVVIEKEKRTYGAYVPDLPGCVAVSRSKPQVRKLIAEAIALHLDAMRAKGEKIPRPSASYELVSAA